MFSRFNQALLALLLAALLTGCGPSCEDLYAKEREAWSEAWEATLALGQSDAALRRKYGSAAEGARERLEELAELTENMWSRAAHEIINADCPAPADWAEREARLEQLILLLEAKE